MNQFSPESASNNLLPWEYQDESYKNRGSKAQQRDQEMQGEDNDRGSDDRTRLIVQNKKLKQQLKEMAGVMQDLIQRDKDYRTKPKKVQKEMEPLELLEIKKQRLRSHQIQVHEIKTGISHLKKLYDVSIETTKLLEKEDELRAYRKEYGLLSEEKEQLLKQKQMEQSKNEKYLQSEEEYEKQMKALRDAVKKTKEENKEISERLIAKEKAVKKLTETANFKEEKIKEMQTKIKERNKILENADQNDVSDEAIIELCSKQKDLEAEKKRNELKFQEDLTRIAKEKVDTSSQYNQKITQAKEKERLHKLNQIKLKEIVKLVRANLNHTLSNARKTPAQIEEQKAEKAILQQLIENKAAIINQEKKSKAEN